MSMQRQRTPPIEAGQFRCAVESSAADVRPSQVVSDRVGSRSKYNVRASYKRGACKLVPSCSDEETILVFRAVEHWWKATNRHFASKSRCGREKRTKGDQRNH